MAVGQEAEQLQAGVRALEKQRAALLRDAQLREEMERQYALRGTQQVGGLASYTPVFWRCSAEMSRLCGTPELGFSIALASPG